LYFRRHHAAEALGTLLHEQTVIEDAGGVDGTPRRGFPDAADIAEDGLHLCFVRNICFDDRHACAARGQRGDRLFVAPRSRPGPAHQDQVSCASFGEQPGDAQAETTDAPGHQIAAVITNRERGIVGYTNRHVRFVVGQHQLPDIARRRHRAERVNRSRRREHVDDQRRERAAGNEREDLLEDRAHLVLAASISIPDTSTRRSDRLPSSEPNGFSTPPRSGAPTSTKRPVGLQQGNTPFAEKFPRNRRRQTTG